MLDRADELTHDRTQAVVAKLLARRSICLKLTPESDLKESGLTSLDMVTLMLAIECEYDITIPQSAMTPENFQSIVSIDSLVTALRA
jgi:acyl carrier protein